MAEGRIKNTELSAIAAAIRAKNGESTVYKPAEMAAAIAAIPTGTTPTGTINITQNGTTDVAQYANANVNVPNSYSQSDEGKVVSNGALVAQTARSSEITGNGTYDTTNNNEVTVNVSGSGGGATILSGTSEPTAAQGSDGALYLQYVVGTNIFGTPENLNPPGGTISATSTYSSYSPNKAFGNQDGWGAYGGSGTLKYEFSAASYKPKRLSFVDYFDVSGGYLKADTFTFDGSNDGVNWDTLYSKTDSATTKDQEKTVDISTNTAYSKFRFVVSGGSGYAGIKNVVCFADSQEKTIVSAHLKVSGAWQDLIGSDINDVGGIS